MVAAAPTVLLAAEEETTMHHASGAFDVQMTPKSLDAPVES